MEQPQVLERLQNGDAPSSIAQTPQFRLFPKLSREVQLMVWEFTVWGLEPRAITMIVSMSREAYPCPQIERGLHYQKEHDILSLLRACRDSRQISLKTYKPCFARHFESGHPEYFNSSKDILVLDSLVLFSFFMRPFCKEEERLIRWRCNSDWLREPCPWGFDQVQNLVLYMRERDIVTPITNIGSIPRHLGQLRNLKTVLVPYMDYGGVIQLWGYNTNTVVQIQEGWKTRQAEFMRVLGQEGEIQPPVVKFMAPREMYAKFHLNYL
jgi:hypothetical protein